MQENLFFWSGVLIAAVPVLLFGTLGGILVYLYVRSQRERAPDDPGSPAEGRRGRS